MKVFLIILAVLFVLTALILSLSATFTIIYDKKWTTKIKVLWIEKEIDLIEILSKFLFPAKSAEEPKQEPEKTDETVIEEMNEGEEDIPIPDDNTADDKSEAKETQPAPQKKKSNPIKSLWDKEGIVGILDLVSNLLQSVSKAGGTLFRGFHIHSLYVKIIVGGGDAAQIAMAYGAICQYYYPVKGIILNGMKVDNYDDLIMPDYMAPSNEYEFQFIGSISVGLLLKVALSAGKTFIINLIKK